MDGRRYVLDTLHDAISVGSALSFDRSGAFNEIIPKFKLKALSETSAFFQFELTKDGEVKPESRLRGLGTDIAIVSSMVFLAQFILSLGMGSIVSWAGTTTAVVSVACFLSFCGAISATRIMYFDL